MNKRIYLSPPDVGEKEKLFLLDAFNSNWIAPLGPYVDDFEQDISHYLKVKNACALSSGTAALHLALRIIDVNEGDIVLCPSLTFIASANVILYQKAIPVFVDVDPNSWTLDIFSLDRAIKKYRPKAIIAVDLYGQSCDYEAITDLCEKYNVLLIEDAAEALGSEYKGEKCGNFGSIGVLSFNGNKIITTSGGGMLLSDNEDFVKKAHYLSTQAREQKIYYEHKEIGYNYRMSNLLAALGQSQLQSLDQFIASRRRVFQGYYDSLSDIAGISFMPEADYGRSNRWLTTLTVDSQKTGINRNQIIEALEKENIEARPVWKPMHMQPLFNEYEYVTEDKKDVSRELFENGICLPSGSNLSPNDQGRIINIIISLLS
jgi:pyridoxal phosphate-dependent aminotransferase EpsN